MSRAFTYVELLVVGGITATIMGLGIASVNRLQTKTTASAFLQQVSADMRSQQLAAMNGATGSTPKAAGVYFQTNKYILFYGNSYTPGSGTNFTVNLDSPWQIATTISGNVAVFASGSGEISTIPSGQRQVTISHPDSGDSATVYINKYGVFQ